MSEQEQSKLPVQAAPPSSREPRLAGGGGEPPSLATEAEISPGRNRSFLDRLPWEKTLIWGAIFLLIYALRSFFFTIFMTFLLSYVVRAIVVKVQSLVSPYQERVWLERILTLACFVTMFFGLFQAGKYLGPELQQQANELYKRVSTIDYEKEFHALQDATVGPWLFAGEYGDEGSDEYELAFAEFKKKGLRVVDYDLFGRLRDSLRAPFEAQIDENAQKQVEKGLSDGTIGDKRFERWFRDERALRIFESPKREELIARWEKEYEEDAKRYQRLPPLEEFRKEANFEDERRRQSLAMIVRDWQKDDAQRELERVAWKSFLVAEARAAVATSDLEEQFRAYYEEQHTKNEEKIPYDYERFSALEAAYRNGSKAFSNLLAEIDNLTDTVDEEDLLVNQHRDFRAQQCKELTAEWRHSDGYGVARKYVIENAGALADPLKAWGKRTLDQFLALPPQIALVFLLSLFITLDLAKLRRGIRRLERSRVGNFYLEIAPGFINFSRLMGRSFLAQGAIAVCNTFLTLVSVKILGIQNEYFLCAIVFFCSFIPVLGVVLSSVPIAVMAMVQPGGDFELAAWAIGAILFIHFLETSLFNPKILGDLLHLHPVMVLACLAIGQHFFGVWGLLLAVPVAVYIYRFLILNEGIPGVIDPVPIRAGPRAEQAEAVVFPVAVSAAEATVEQALEGGASASAGAEAVSEDTVGEERASDDRAGAASETDETASKSSAPKVTETDR